MAKIASLFGSQEEATAALERLAQFDFYHELETDVIDTFAAQSDMELATVTAVMAPETHQMIAPAIPYWPVAGLDVDEEEAEFFERGLRNGGVLVVVSGDDKYARPVRQLLNEAGGRTSRQDH
jgi:hypothetical protein